MMQVKRISIIFIGFILLISCESRREITDQNLLGVWREKGPHNGNTKEVRGILISTMDSGLYEEEIIILQNKAELNYSVFSDGCFIKLKTNEKKEQVLNYICLAGEFEHPIIMTREKLKIGNRIFEKYNH